MKIADFNISARAKSCLLRAGYSDIEDLQGISNDILLNIKNINLNCVSEIRNAIDSLQSMKDKRYIRESGHADKAKESGVKIQR